MCLPIWNCRTRTGADQGPADARDCSHHQGPRPDSGGDGEDSRDSAAPCFGAYPQSCGVFLCRRLIDVLTALGKDVEITVTPARKEHGAMSIVFA